MADDHFDAAVAALTQMVVGRESLDQSLQRVSDLALAHVPGAASVSVTIVDDRGSPRTAACSDETALAIDEAQYAASNGPCVDCYRHGTIVRVDSVLAAHRWPQFGTAALHQGIRASLSAPLLIERGGVGAINLYAPVENAWTQTSEHAAARLADQATIAVVNAMLYHEAVETAEHLRRAVESRDLIGQAKGILMERHKITADQAFHMLRELSQRRNVKLRDVAQAVADAGTPAVGAGDAATAGAADAPPGASRDG